MKNTLDALSSVDGINGVFLCSDQGDLVEFSASEIYDQETLLQASSVVARATESISVQHDNCDNMVAHFKDGKLIMLRVDNHILCVITNAGTNMPFLNVAIKVAKKKLKRQFEKNENTMENSSLPYQSSIPSNFNNNSDMRTNSSIEQSNTQPSMHSSFTPHNPTQNSSMKNSGFSSNSELLWSGMGASAMNSSAVAVADKNASQMLTKLSQALAEVVGPMAKVFVKEAVHKICTMEPFSMQHVKLVLKELEEQHVTDPDEIKTFRQCIYK